MPAARSQSRLKSRGSSLPRRMPARLLPCSPPPSRTCRPPTRMLPVAFSLIFWTLVLVSFFNHISRSTECWHLIPLGEIGSRTLTPGLYKWTTAVTVSSPLTFSGGPSDSAFFTSSYLLCQLIYDLYRAWILQIAGTLTVASAQTVLLAGGAHAKNIIWAVASGVTLGTTSHFEGVILGKTGITLQTGMSMNGRALSQTFVACQKATVVPPS